MSDKKWRSGARAVAPNGGGDGGIGGDAGSGRLGTARAGGVEAGSRREEERMLSGTTKRREPK